MLWYFATALIAVYKPRFLIAFIVLLIIGWVAWDIFYVPPRDRFIEENNLTLTGQQATQVGPGIYAENTTHYFLLFPANYHKIAINNNCKGFYKLNKDTWCGDEAFFPTCYPGSTKCSSVTVFK